MWDLRSAHESSCALPGRDFACRLQPIPPTALCDSAKITVVTGLQPHASGRPAGHGIRLFVPASRGNGGSGEPVPGAAWRLITFRPPVERRSERTMLCPRIPAQRLRDDRVSSSTVRGGVSMDRAAKRWVPASPAANLADGSAYAYGHMTARLLRMSSRLRPAPFAPTGWVIGPSEWCISHGWRIPHSP